MDDIETVQRERDELSRRLNDALARLAASDAGAYSVASGDGAPQHDQLVQRFRQLKLQDFQALTFMLYSIWQKRPGNAAVKPAQALALCREKLAQEVLVEGSRLLCIRRGLDAGSDLEAVRHTIYGSIRSRFKMRNTPPLDLEEKLRAAIARSVELMQAMSSARPAACLLVPSPRTPFAADLHEAAAGCADGPAAVVHMTIFPGYLVAASNRVLEKALVWTE